MSEKLQGGKESGSKKLYIDRDDEIKLKLAHNFWHWHNGRTEINTKDGRDT